MWRESANKAAEHRGITRIGNLTDATDSLCTQFDASVSENYAVSQVSTKLQLLRLIKGANAEVLKYIVP